MLNSKISIPNLKKKLIKREIKLSSYKEKILVFKSAVGFGKTTFVSSYLSSARIPYIWYTLDKYDNDINEFFNYLLKAIENITGKKVIDRKCNILDKAEQISAAFAKFVKIRPIIVLDNFESISNDDIITLLKYIIDNCNARLFIITNGKVPDFILNYILIDEVKIIDSDNLKFNKKDVELLFKSVDKELVNDIYYNTCGWPAAITLLKTYCSNKDIESYDLDALFRESMLYSYISSYIYNNLSYNEKLVFESVSLFDSFDVELTNYVSGVENSEEVLNNLCSAGIFLKEGRNYKYSMPIFKKYIFSEINASKKALIIRKSVDYYNKKGDSCIPFKQLLINNSKKCEISMSEEDLSKISGGTNLNNDDQYMYIKCFGAFNMYPYGIKDSNIIKWKTKKVKELLALLLDNKGMPISRKDIMKYLWPDEYPNHAVAMFHNMIYNIRKELTPLGFGDLVEYKNKNYFMKIDNVKSDLFDMERLCNIVKSKNINNLIDNEYLFNKYNGEYLEDIDCWWGMEKKKYYERYYLAGCSMLAEYYMNIGDYEKAISFLNVGMTVDIYSEKVAADLIYCYSMLGDTKNAKKSYDNICHILKKELDAMPGEKLKRVYEQYVKKSMIMRS